MSSQTNTRTTDAFLAKMRRRFKVAEEALQTVHADALTDWAFRLGDQWDAQIEAQRKADGRPCYTVNRIPQFIRQITGQQKQNRPAIRISPIGDGADVETAEIEQGLVRHIESASNAEDAYDTAFDCMATGGFGFLRVVTDYCDSESNDQDILIQREPNPFAHYPDPSCRQRDYSDAKFWFVVDDMTRDEFEEEYPNSEIVGLTEFGTLADNAQDWIKQDSIRVAEYFYIESKTEKGRKNGRDKTTKIVHWCLTNGVEILDERIIPGEYIPIVPVLGEEVIVKGKRTLVSVVRHARTPQTLYNLWHSAMAESIALAPKAPYLVTPGQIEGYEDIWDKANSENLPYLPVNPDPKAPGWPMRQVIEPATQAIQSALMHADNDLKSTTGLYDASLGAPGPEQSGKAILARKQQGESANFSFTDAMKPAVKHAGRIIIGWIPFYYDAPRVVRIVHPDRTSKTVKVNQHFQDDDGLMKVFDLTTGKYDVSVSSGPSFESARQEAAASIMDLVKAYPEMMNVVGDLLVQNFDWPLAPEIAERLRKMLPPQLQDEGQGATPEMQAAQAQLQQLQAMVKQLLDEKRSKQMELQSKERIAALQVQAELVQTEAKINAGRAEFLIGQEYDRLSQQMGQQHDIGMSQMDHGEALQASQQGAQQQAAQAQQQNQFQLQQAAMPKPQPLDGAA
jgi:hypothetical protein